jgi:Na+-driven multidrug efflux pump
VQISVAHVGLNIFCNFVLVYWGGLGLTGCALALDITYWYVCVCALAAPLFPFLFRAYAIALCVVFALVWLCVALRCVALRCGRSQFLSLLWWVRRRALHAQTWFGWSRDALKEWKPFIALGLPGAAMVCAEWWGFEVPSTHFFDF